MDTAPSRRVQASPRAAVAPGSDPGSEHAPPTGLRSPSGAWSLLCPSEAHVHTCPRGPHPPRISEVPPHVPVCAVSAPGPSAGPRGPTQCWPLPCRTQRPSTRCLLRMTGGSQAPSFHQGPDSPLPSGPQTISLHQGPRLPPSISAPGSLLPSGPQLLSTHCERNPTPPRTARFRPRPAGLPAGSQPHFKEDGSSARLSWDPL